MHRATLMLIFGLLAILSFVVLDPTSREDSAGGKPPQDDHLVIPGLDWVALAAWTHDHAAAEGPEGDRAGQAELLESLRAFHRAAGDSGTADAIDSKHLDLLFERLGQWGKRHDKRAELLVATLLRAGQDPEAWGRLLRALGPGLVTGAHDFLLESKPKLLERVPEARAELAGATGETRAKLESDLASLHDLIRLCDQIPPPSVSARAQWETIQQLDRDKREAASKKRAATGP